MSVPDTARHAVLVLAAGASRRLGQPKQLLQRDGETLLHRSARLALETRPAQVVVVLGAGAEAGEAAIRDLAVHCVRCTGWQEGMGASLRCGIAALRDDSEGTLLLLCDQPALDPGHLQALLNHWRADPQRAVASGYAGTLGVPAVVPRAWHAALQALRGDAGARSLLRARPAEVDRVLNEALAHDIDTPADLMP